MTEPGTRGGAAGGPLPRRRVGETREVLRLAWPAVASYILHNAYRINDQFWVQGLGGEAQAAVGTAFFVVVLNFAVIFLAAGGTLALVARAVGAGDRERADSVTRHALLFGCAIALVLGTLGSLLTGEIVGLLGFGRTPEAAAYARDYLSTLYALILPVALVPVLDNAFIGRGHTKVPMVLDLASILLNYLLNPVLIYGGTAAATLENPPFGAGAADAIARALSIEPLGMRGAAAATCISRAVSVGLGLAILKAGFGTSLLGSLRPRLSRVAEIARLSAPVSISIAVYAGVYLAMFAIVMEPLGYAVKGGLGIGFQVFEGLAFPCYLGVAVAGASLVGRRLGGRDPAGARDVVRSVRFVGRCVGLFMTVLFLGASRVVVPLFTQDPLVAEETLRYVGILALSQYWVAVETVNEKVLLGSGHTRPILWIAGLGNVVRVPLAWFLALHLGHGAPGVWWAINLTTYVKAGLFWRAVERGARVTHLERRERDRARHPRHRRRHRAARAGAAGSPAAPTPPTRTETRAGGRRPDAGA